MGPQQESENLITVPHLAGLNERMKFANSNASEFDTLQGLISQRKGILQRPPGTRLLAVIEGKQILNIFQTLDRRQNVLVQTDSGVYLYSENELLGTTVPTNLIPITLTEEENMSQAIIVQRMAAGANGGTYTTGNVWQDAPLTEILSQRNPDGTVATFVTALAANVITLAVGYYRIRGWSVASHATATVRATARMFNVTTGLPLWNGLSNQETDARFIGTANDNMKLEINGWIDLTGGITQIKLQHLMLTAQANTGFGSPKNSGGFSNSGELYRCLEILKTA